jgi:hypothetical protein
MGHAEAAASAGGEVEMMPRDVRQLLLGALMAPAEDRAALIGRLHERASTPGLVELLIDLEVNRATALDLAEALKDSL